ncbi:Alpha/Beta hydrolase protein [Podospora fimiseda]|uniref:Alpha/Beta hydrolase protein n=1 Tax=Podospora fimiseda TaxID=252190 RepID=A0AAN7GS32_9PEZI|nr:Alpha/Beta hydrolase protein [Podospora fimiseda]
MDSVITTVPSAAFTTPKPILPLSEKLSLVVKLLLLGPPKLVFNIIRCHAIATVRGISYQHFVQCAFIKFALRHLSPLQIQALSPATLAGYKGWIKRRQAQATKSTDKTGPFLSERLKVDIEPLSDGLSSICWIGDRTKATKFVYFLHGGGYAAPMSLGHFEWCLRAYLQASLELPADSTEEVAIAVLQYTLVPHGQYPTQLKQAADGLTHLLASGVRPENLVIGGDSAGGNLAVQLLSHLLHPHLEAKKITLQNPLAGAFLVSPWVSGKTDGPSFKRNGGIDMLCKNAIGSGVRNLVEGVESYEVEVKENKMWCFPADFENAVVEEWFKNLEEVVKHVYVTAGEEEVFLDQSVKIAEVIRTANPKLDVRVEVTKGEAHDWILMEGEKKIDGDATKRMRSWVKDVFWA